ncbi:MAG: YetF domain-containing protein [Mycobacteriaceae bacterium]
MSWISGDWQSLGQVAGKAVLMYVIALVGLRLGERRTLAQWTIIDFATAVAIGAIVGRTAIAGDQSFLTGAAALLTLVVVHRLASWLRFHPTLGKLFDHRVRVLVVNGELRRGQLRRCGLTDNDLFAQLRQRGIQRLSNVRYVLYESKGDLTIVGVGDDATATGDLIDAGLQSSVGFQPASAPQC